MTFNIRISGDPRLISILERLAWAVERIANQSDDRQEVIDLTDQLRKSNDKLASHVAAKTPSKADNKGVPK